MADLAVKVVDSEAESLFRYLAIELAERGMRPRRIEEAVVPPDLPLLLVGSHPEVLSNCLCASGRTAPTFAWLLEPHPDESVLALLDRGATEVYAARGEDSVKSLVAHMSHYLQVLALRESALVRTKFGGRSGTWLKVVHELVSIARSDFAAVLILGETGTGKDGAARLLHEAGRSASGEFVVVHCGAIVATLSGSELFGHRRGAFSGADRDRDGAIARAHGGTLFLDEVAELSAPLQTELLRVLQDGTFRPVGDDRERVSRFRLVAATHKDLKEEVAKGTFREDLYFRLRGAEVRLPALRERREDIPELIERFANEFLGEQATVDPRVVRLLSRLSFPGNVRELKALVRAACARCPSGQSLRLGCMPSYVLRELGKGSVWSDSDLVPSAERAVLNGVAFNEFVDAAKDALVKAALGLARGNVKEAAQRISVSERCVQLRRRTERGSGAPPAPEVDDALEAAG